MKVDTNIRAGDRPLANSTTPQEDSAASALPTLLTVPQFAKKHPFLTESAVRAYIYAAQSRAGARGVIAANGLESALVRKGRRVFIHEDKFFLWFTKK